MLNSKAVSDDFWSKDESWLRGKISDLTSSLRAFLRKVKRALAFAVHGWNSYDWDYGYLLDLIEFKLKRMQKEIKNGHHVPDKATDQSIRICIKLLKKINRRDYHYFAGLHDQKWGESEWVFHKTDENGQEISNGGSRLEIVRPKAVTPEEKEQERTEALVAYRMDDAQRERDVRWLFNIMAKYHQCWWD
jgi:hypothetical protein